jgi:hypothetical protein
MARMVAITAAQLAHETGARSNARFNALSVFSQPKLLAGPGVS